LANTEITNCGELVGRWWRVPKNTHVYTVRTGLADQWTSGQQTQYFADCYNARTNKPNSSTMSAEDLLKKVQTGQFIECFFK